ncbi:MAG TPA: ATP-binding cassette domain-containing protein [Ignavibacteria bacterium]|nr:ATP-binding cassette domain-containing protein [Ignavibacteria bacterium]HMR41454.1 ATP-binding cassette domain-containing protein [Ignavibacteria bacterium]
MIKIKKLTVRYGENVVLDDINIEFPLNNIYGIVGLNGSGKTTFFNTLSTLLKSTSGEIYFNDNEIKLADTGYLETGNYFYSRLTGNEYLKIFKQTNAGFKLDSLQQFTKLPLDDLIETYSTGMKKKLALLAVLKQDKPVYLFDEPFNGIDMETNKIIELIIHALKEKGRTVFISSHILDPLIRLCDKIYFLENGKFTKTYNKEDYHKMENELFDDLKQKAKSTIFNSV